MRQANAICGTMLVLLASWWPGWQRGAPARPAGLAPAAASPTPARAAGPVLHLTQVDVEPTGYRRPKAVADMTAGSTGGAGAPKGMQFVALRARFALKGGAAQAAHPEKELRLVYKGKQYPAKGIWALNLQLGPMGSVARQGTLTEDFDVVFVVPAAATAKGLVVVGPRGQQVRLAKLKELPVPSAAP